MEEQVAPAMERVAETPVSAQAASALAKQCEHLFEALVTRGNELAAQLGADAPHTGDRGHDDAATHLAYFDQLFAALEGPVAKLREMIEDESRQLLGVVVDRIFTNLKLLTPGFDFSSVTEAAQGEDAQRVSSSLREQVDAFYNRFRRAEAAAEDSEEEACSAETEEGAAEEVQGGAASP